MSAEKIDPQKLIEMALKASFDGDTQLSHDLIEGMGHDNVHLEHCPGLGNGHVFRIIGTEMMVEMTPDAAATLTKVE